MYSKEQAAKGEASFAAELAEQQKQDERQNRA
jgi:hypothetical protein